ncbi:MAG: FAD-binding oxidoreductase, partial [Deltaproteobacteria bacterium]|nr:FAD-binding oxidoreductase [Deltaproteobacteria bacterium]
MDLAFLNKLKQIVGNQHVAFNPTDVEVYSYDASLAVRTPGAVVFPGNTNEIASVVRACAEARIPFVPRGFGTNLSGGSVAPEGG